MKKHNFTALTTFRGWSEEKSEWIYGNLVAVQEGLSLIVSDKRSGSLNAWGNLVFEPEEFNEVHLDSIGVYTGKDDKDGNPIFCGVAGAKYGGDVLTGHGYYEYSVMFDGEIIMHHQDGKWGPLHRLYDDDMDELREMLSVAKSQWEDYLKATNET